MLNMDKHKEMMRMIKFCNYLAVCRNAFGEAMEIIKFVNAQLAEYGHWDDMPITPLGAFKMFSPLQKQQLLRIISYDESRGDECMFCYKSTETPYKIIWFSVTIYCCAACEKFHSNQQMVRVTREYNKCTLSMFAISQIFMADISGVIKMTIAWLAFQC